jgi:hypothetical protein
MTQTTIQEIRKKKLSKTYDELLSEVKNLFRKSASVYVPELCQALAVEHTDWSNKEIQNKVYLDLEGFWSTHTIRDSLPSWILKPGYVAGAKKGWETKNANKLKSSSKILETFEKVDLPPPPATPKTRESEDEEFEEISEDMDAKLTELGMGRFGSQGKTLRSVLGDINHGLAGTFKALTETKDMPTETDDLLVDFIRPTREFRKSLALELEHKHRTQLHNWCHYASVVIEDMIEQIKVAEEGGNS